MLLMLLFAIAVGVHPTIPMLVFTTLVVIGCTLDLTRARPYLYQYTVMLVAIVFCAPADALGICRLIPACIYFWSGVLKLNTQFLSLGYPWVIEALSKRLPPSLAALLARLAPTIPVVEALLGLGLIFPATRTASLIGVVAMHAFIMLCFSPLGHRSHGEVIPWNLSMLATNLILFTDSAQASAKSILVGDASLLHLAVLLVFAGLPLLGLFNKIDPFFSHAHMAGRHPIARLYLSCALYSRLPQSIQAHCDRLDEANLYTLFLPTWYLQELEVPPPHWARAAKSIARDFAKYGASENDLQLMVFWLNGLYNLEWQNRTYRWSEL